MPPYAFHDNYKESGGDSGADLQINSEVIYVIG